jgi:PAS domain S-box-containing protein
MRIDKVFQDDISSKTKDELIEEVLKLRKNFSTKKNHGSQEYNKTNKLSTLIVENSHDGIMIIGDDFKIEYLNNRLCQITESKPEFLLNKDFRELLSDYDKENIIQRFTSRNKGHKIDSHYELTLKTSKGKEKVFEVRSTLFKESTGKIKTLSQFKEITERKLAEEAIKQSEEKFRSIVENSHLGIAIIGMDFNFEYVNDQLCKILNIKKEEIEGIDFRKFISQDSMEIVVDRYKKRQHGEEVPSEYEIKLIRSDGEERIVKLSSSIVRFQDGVKSIAQILDLTENVKKENLQKVLLRISQAVNEENNLSEFLAIVREELALILDTTNFYVAMYDGQSDTYSFPYHVDEYDVVDEFTQLDLKKSLTDFVRRKDQAILVDINMQNILEQQNEINGVVGEFSQIWLGAPLVVDNVVVGVIGIQNYHNAKAYNHNDLELLKIVSENVSSAIWKKQIVDKLTESERRYRDFISRSSEGIYRLDFTPPINIKLPLEEQINQILNNGVIGECNNAFAKMYSLNSYKEILGNGFDKFIREDQAEKAILLFKDFILNNYKINDRETLEYNFLNEKINVLNNAVGIIKNDHLNNIWGIKKDITESNRLQNVLKTIAQGISSSIGDTFFKSLVAFLGETLKVDYAFIAQSSDDKISANTLAFWNKHTLMENFTYQLENSPSKYIIEKNQTTLLNDVINKFPKDEKLKKFHAKTYMGKPLVNSDGKTIGIIVIIKQDEMQNIEFTKSVLEIFASRSAAEIERLQYVKEIVAAKEEAEKSNSLKSDFLAQMSHEIRTPVNTILSFTSLLKESLQHQLDDDLKDSFKFIENGGRRLIRTIDLILDVSQIQSGNLALVPTKINLIAILEEIISEFKQTAVRKNLELIFDSEHEKLYVLADNYTITQTFANLLHNAIKYTTTGSITVKAYKSYQNEIFVEFHDTGVGMSEHFLTKLFEPFSQEETGYTRKFEGTGLGLTLVRNYCELNNAQIFVDSKKNIGTTFIVKFSEQNIL